MEEPISRGGEELSLGPTHNRPCTQASWLSVLNLPHLPPDIMTQSSKAPVARSSLHCTSEVNIGPHLCGRVQSQTLMYKGQVPTP